MKMKKYLVVVITRMYMPRGDEHDEFIYWYKGILNDPVSVNSLFIPISKSVDLLIIHGCSDNFEPGPINEYVRSIAERIRKETEKSSTYEYDEVLLILHPPSLSEKELSLLKEADSRITTVYQYSSMDSEYIFTVLKELKVPEKEKSIIINYFASLLKGGWKRYLDPSQSLDEIKKRQKVIRLK